MQTVLIVIEQILDHHDTWFIFLKVEARENLKLPPFDVNGQNIDMVNWRCACRQNCIESPQVHSYFFNVSIGLEALVRCL